MSKLSRILLVENATPPGSPAYHRAVELARRSGAELLICQLVHDPLIDFASGLADAALHHARSGYMLERQQPLERAREALQQEGLRVSAEVVWTAAPHEAVIAKSIEHNPDLVIANLERRRDLLGVYVVASETWKLARLCPAPLMLVHERRPLLPTRMTVAVDTVDHLADVMLNEEVINVARIVGNAAGVPLDLLHVFPLHPAPAHGELDDSYQKLLLRDQQRLQQMADDAGIPHDRCHWRGGDLHRELYNYASADSGELLVLGSVYHNAFSRLFLGSTTESVISGFPCDVLVVKPAGFLRELARHRDLNALCDAYGVVATELLDAA
ncbi:MAG TPA: universal stress protein [Solimonas sp.]|nr:universal stress protein [Solimonas sp.]